jgi:hypothetical protein
MATFIIAPCSFLEYSAFIISANALRLGTSPIFGRKGEQQQYHHTLPTYQRKNNETNNKVCFKVLCKESIKYDMLKLNKYKMTHHNII